MKKRKIAYVFLGLVGIVGSSILFINRDKVYIKYALARNDYAYLPSEAKDYIKEIYDITGNLMLTEKNKKEKMPYLNPDYVEYLTYSDEKKEQVDVIPDVTLIDYIDNNVINELPSSYDLRNVDGKNYVSPIGNQGNMGLCWTFGSTGAAEGYLLKKNDTSYNSNSTLFSQRQLDYATSRDGIKDYDSEYQVYVLRKLGGGGNFYISTVSFANGISLVNNNNFKAYNDKDYEKMELNDVLNYSKSDYELNSTLVMPINSYRINEGNLTDEEKKIREDYINKIKESIMKYGVAYVSTYMDCSHNDSKLNNLLIDDYNCKHEQGHAMSIIGWDDNIEYEYCTNNIWEHYSDTTNCSNIVKGKGAWILKNSWGSNSPNPYLTYDSYNVNVSFVTDMSEREEKNWDNNYILGSNASNGTDILYRMAYTKLKGEEKLEKIKFMVNSLSAEFDILVRDVNGKISTKRVSSSDAGLITVDFSNDNIVLNESSSVQIKKANSNSVFIDTVSFFTSNTSDDMSINFSDYDGKTYSNKEYRFYSDTKGIPSGSTIDYKLYNSSNEEVSGLTVTNNIVAENNINTSISISIGNIDSGNYVIKAFYNGKEVGSFKLKFAAMQGSGTESDPYVILNPIHFDSIRDDLDAYYVLGDDLDFTEYTKDGGILSEKSENCPQGFGWKSIDGFSGTLDGKGHTIKGLNQRNYIECYNKEPDASMLNNGLFGTMKENVVIKNLKLEDFDINCHENYCGILVSEYISNMNANGGKDTSDTTEYNALFENISVKNSKVNIVNKNIPGRNLSGIVGGGLFGRLDSSNGNIKISNIYINVDIISKKYFGSSYLSYYIAGKNTDIQNVSLSGISNEYSQYISLINSVFGDNSINIKNVVSSTDSQTFLNGVWTDNLTLDGINLLNSKNMSLYDGGKEPKESTNINIYDKDTDIKELVKKENYSSWKDFDDNWVMKTVDGIPRMPVLKFMDFDYTKIDDITIKQELNKKVNILDYVTPNTDAAKRINYKSNNDKIVKISDDGVIIPQSSGKTTIHFESLYDGYINDVPISVTYVPHYTINFDTNGGSDKIDSIEVPDKSEYKLQAYTGSREGYVFAGWNTKADGTGTSYDDKGIVDGMNDKEEITLYAQWLLDEYITFDANGGNVGISSKRMPNNRLYGDLPIPYKKGSGFMGWYCENSGSYANYDDDANCNNLVAKWQDDAYTVVMNANGGQLKDNVVIDSNKYRKLSKSTISSSYDYFEDYITSEVIFENGDKSFVEWNDRKEGDGRGYQPNVMLNSDETDFDENYIFTLYAIWEDEIPYKISKYDVDLYNNYISRILPNTSKEEFSKNITLSNGYRMEVDTNNDNGYLYTGGKVKIYHNDELYITFTTSVIGDVSGDGVVNSADLLGIRWHLLGTKALSGEKFLASDIDNDSTITSADLLRVRWHLLGTRKIS